MVSGAHNRYVLEYDDSLEVARPWKDFVVGASQQRLPESSLPR